MSGSIRHLFLFACAAIVATGLAGSLSAAWAQTDRVIPAKGGEPAAPGKPRAFRCGELMLIASFPEDAADLVLEGEAYRLDRDRSASGARFSRDDGALSFWLKGDIATLTQEGAQSDCEAVAPAAILPGREWIVEDVDGGGVIDNSRSSITFGMDGRMSGLAGCNTYGGAWQAEGYALETSQLVTTRKACAPALNRQEAIFLTILTGAARFELTGTGALVIHGRDGRSMTARPR